MIKIYSKQEITDTKQLFDKESWDFPIEELDYLLEEHNNESFVLMESELGNESRLLEIEEQNKVYVIYEINEEKLKEAINHFNKTYMQEVPIYSAVKVNGRKLYDYARNNEKVELPKKEVTIYSLELIEIKDDIVKIKCKVSKGTYIRSLIRDIGEYLGTYASMTNLERISLDNFKIEDACLLEDLNNNNYKLYDIKDFLDVSEINIKNEEEYKHIKNGNVVDMNTNKYVLFTYNNENIALYMPYDNKIKPLIMF